MDKKKKLKDDEALPPDLISEILYRLPVKLLCRFRLVCKPWNQLISSKEFHDKHYHRLAQQRPLLLTACPDSIDEDTPPKNPATREVIALPQFGTLNHCTGFGYDEVKDEFKVVRFFTTGKTRCAVFCLGSERWREVACPPLSCANDNLRAPLVNGAVHVLSDSKNRYEEARNAAIYGFNIVNEYFAKIKLPADYYVATAEAYPINLNELRGCLCMTFNFETNIDVWMLKDYGNEVWEKVYTIEAEGANFIPGEPLLATSDGSILLQIFSEERALCKLNRYDPNDGEYYEKVDDNCVATSYVESLFPLGGGPVPDGSSDCDEDDDEDADEDNDEDADEDDDENADEDDDELSNNDADEDDDELPDNDDDEK